MLFRSASVLLPALLEPQLRAVAAEHHRAHPEGASPHLLSLWLGALVPRVMHPGGWAAAARQAGAETLWTERARPYHECTLRLAAGRLDAEGCTDRIALALRDQVRAAVAAQDEPVVAYTDIFDQAYYYSLSSPHGASGAVPRGGATWPRRR